MSYLYPPYPVIPATLPPDPLGLRGTGGTDNLYYQDDVLLLYSGGYNFYLRPSYEYKYKPFYIKLWAWTPVTIIPAAGETIDGYGSLMMSLFAQTCVLFPWAGQGWISVGSHKPPLKIRTAAGGTTYLAEDDDVYLTPENGVVYLPSSTRVQKKRYTIKNYSGGPVTVYPAGGEYIDFQTSYVLPRQMSTITIVPHSEQPSYHWWIISSFAIP